MINRIEWIRKQLDDLKAVLQEDKAAEAVLKAGEELNKKLMDEEGFSSP